MKSYLVSFAAGLLVGCIYSLIRVRSPAPPLIALIGLLGIVLGEQGPPLVKQLFFKESTNTTQASELAEPQALNQSPKASIDLEGKS